MATVTWKQASNPPPYSDTSVTWIITVGDAEGTPGVTVRTLPAYEGKGGPVVTIRSGPTWDGSTLTVAFTAARTGASVVVVTDDNGDLASHYIFVGQFLMYSPDGMLWAAQSASWSPIPSPTPDDPFVPTLQAMNDKSAGAAWAPPSSAELPSPPGPGSPNGPLTAVPDVACYILNAQQIDENLPVKPGRQALTETVFFQFAITDPDLPGEG